MDARVEPAHDGWVGSALYLSVLWWQHHIFWARL
jgi:hypothetical protein